MNGVQQGLSVEFLGLPGAGKSSVSHRVAACLAGRGRPVAEHVRELSDRRRTPGRLRGYVGKSLLVAGEVALHPATSLAALRAIRGTRQPSLRVLLGVSFNWLMQCAVARAGRRGRAIQLSDEGLYQALWSIGLEGRPGAVHAVGRLLERGLPRPDLVVLVDAPARAVAQRLAGRGGHESRADGWGAEDAEAMTRATRALGDVMRLLVEAGRGGRAPRVIRVDNGPARDLGAIARRLAAEFERLADPYGQPAPGRPAGAREPCRAAAAETGIPSSAWRQGA